MSRPDAHEAPTKPGARPPPGAGAPVDEVADSIGLSRRPQHERSAGRFPPPDRIVGRMPLWAPATIQRWIEGGAR